MKLYRPIFTIILAAALGTSSLYAITAREMRVDFSTLAGSSSLDGTWTHLANNDIDEQDLLNFETGIASGATISLLSFTTNSDTDAWTGTNAWLDGLAGDDTLATINASASVILDGMGTEGWKIELASVWNNTQLLSNFTINSAGADTTGNGDPVPTNWSGQSDGQDNWLVWNEITPVGGTITIDVSKIGTAAGISALRLTQVPEPSTYALIIGCGLLGLVAWRRGSC